MYKIDLEYEDFTGETVQETLYFNLTKTEAMALASKEDGKYVDILKNIAEMGNPQRILEVFTELVLSSYGVRSEDGRRFMKNDTLREEFRCSAAFDELMSRLITDKDTSVEFINAIIPTKGINDMLEKMKENTKEISND